MSEHDHYQRRLSQKSGLPRMRLAAAHRGQTSDVLVRPLSLLKPGSDLAGNCFDLLSHAFQCPFDRSGAFPTAQRLHHGIPGRKLKYFPSYKQGGSVVCRGDLMHARCLLLEADPDVEAYRTFPAVLPSGAHRYTPSIAVRRTDGSLAVEHLVYDGELSQSVKADGDFIRQHLANDKVSFSFSIASDVLAQPRLNNLLYCYRARRGQVLQESKDLVSAFIKDRGGAVGLKVLQGHLGAHLLSSLIPLYLLWDGYLDYDRTQQIRATARIWLKK